MDLAGLVAGAGWASGLNLYAVVAMIGLAGRLNLAEVPDALARPEVIAIAVVMYLIEFVVDKIPWLDSTWDVLHTAVRPIGGAAIAALLAGDATSVQQAVAAASGGMLSLTGHAAKASVRALLNTSPEPVSNVVASVSEDGLVAGVVVLALANPVLALAVVAVLALASIVVAVLLIGALRRGWQHLAQRGVLRRRRPQVPFPLEDLPPPRH